VEEEKEEKKEKRLSLTKCLHTVALAIGYYIWYRCIQGNT